MKVMDISYKDFFRFLEFDNSSEEEQIKGLVDADGDGEYFAIKPDGSYVQINAVIKKPKQEYVTVTMSSRTHGTFSKDVSPMHMFKVKQGTCFAKDSEFLWLESIYGDVEVLSVEHGGEDELYDISIESPHLYIDNRGLIHHNSFVGLKVSKNAQKIDKDWIVIYIDTEMAFDYDFSESVGIDRERLLVIQSNQIEDVQQQVMAISKELDKEERKKVLMVIDSWGGLVTSKTVNDATSGNDAADFTVAKKKNTFAKLLTGMGMTIFVVNQVYDNMSLYDPLTIGGGRGLYFASSSIVLGTSKARAKDTASSTEVTGALILATTKKSRFCKELTKLRYLIKYDGGIHPAYGILDDLVEMGFVIKPTMGYYSRPSVEGDKKWREKQIWDDWKGFFGPILSDPAVSLKFEEKYTFLHSEINDEDFDEFLKN